MSAFQTCTPQRLPTESCYQSPFVTPRSTYQFHFMSPHVGAVGATTTSRVDLKPVPHTSQWTKLSAPHGRVLSTATNDDNRAVAGYVATTAEKLCRVCGDRASGRHYGVISCEGCKSFFKRSLRTDVRYSCHYSQVCPINVQSRSRCQYCRLQKCFLVGMRKEGIRRKCILKEPSMVSLPASLISSPLNVGAVPQFYPPPYSLIPTPLRAQLAAPVSPTIKHHHQFHSFASYPRPIDFRKDETICTNILRHIVEWAKDLPVFANIPQTDQEDIVQSNWFEIFVLITVQHHLLPDLRAFLKRGSLSGEKSIASVLRDLESQVEQWGALNCDHVELECLKAIVMYNAGSPRLACRSTLERLQGDTMGSLQSYIKSHHVSHAARFGRLLLQLGELRRLKSEVTKLDIFFPELQNQSEFISDLIKEELSQKRASNSTPAAQFYKYDIPRH